LYRCSYGSNYSLQSQGHASGVESVARTGKAGNKVALTCGVWRAACGACGADVWRRPFASNRYNACTMVARDARYHC
jgi:hypothetical protein